MSTSGVDCPPSVRHYPRFDPRTAPGRVLLALAVGMAVAWLLPDRHGIPLRIVAGWDAGSLSLLSFVWVFILTGDSTRTSCRAASADPGRTVVWFLVLMASTFSLFSAAFVMRHAHRIDPERGSLLLGLSLIAVGTSWSLTHTSYTLRYAHLYYRDEGGVGGLVFPGDRPPDDFDFAYFAYTIGMCFQVSDVVITSWQIRRAVLSHAVLSFAYNTVILALALNLLFGVLA